MDRSVIQKAINGNPEAFELLYRETHDKGYSVAYSILKDSYEAEDILQEAYISMYQKIDTLQNLDGFESWFYRIVRNAALDFLRKQRPALFSSFENDEAEDFHFEETLVSDYTPFDPEANVDYEDTKRIMAEIVGALPDMQKRCIQLRFQEDMKISEIAASLDIPESTVKSNLTYGKKKIEEEVKKLEKKGVRLYSFAPVLLIPFLRWMYGNQVPSSLTSAAASAAKITAAETAVAAGAAKTAAAAGGVAGTASASAGVAAATVAAKAVGVGLATKIIAGVCAVSLLGGGIALAATRLSKAKLAAAPESNNSSNVDTAITTDISNIGSEDQEVQSDDLPMEQDYWDPNTDTIDKLVAFKTFTKNGTTYDVPVILIDSDDARELNNTIGRQFRTSAQYGTANNVSVTVYGKHLTITSTMFNLDEEIEKYASYGGNISVLNTGIYCLNITTGQQVSIHNIAENYSMDEEEFFQLAFEEAVQMFDAKSFPESYIHDALSSSTIIPATYGNKIILNVLSYDGPDYVGHWFELESPYINDKLPIRLDKDLANALAGNTGNAADEPEETTEEPTEEATEPTEEPSEETTEPTQAPTEAPTEATSPSEEETPCEHFFDEADGFTHLGGCTYGIVCVKCGYVSHITHIHNWSGGYCARCSTSCEHYGSEYTITGDDGVEYLVFDCAYCDVVTYTPVS